MSTTPRKNRKPFRPSLEGVRLEDRVVLSASPMAAAAQGSGLGDITSRQLNVAYRQQFRALQDGLRNFVNTQVDELYAAPNLGADGRPNGEALANFSNRVAGALNATTLGVSAQTAILPGAGRRLLPTLQNSILGSGRGSLASRIGDLVDSGRAAGSRRLFQSVLDRQINMNFAINTAQVSNYLRLAPLNRLAVDPTTGHRVGLSRYLGEQAAQQINSTFGTLANSVGANARSTLFDETGAFNAQGIDAFRQQYGQALGTAAYQVNSVLSVFPNSSSLRSQVQAGLFGEGTVGDPGQTAASLYNSLQGAFPNDPGVAGTAFTPDAFNTGFQNQFTTAYQNFTNPINNFLGYQPNATGTGPSLPNGFFQNDATFPGLLGSRYSGSSFNSGFNNGFNTAGTGFPGFGSAPTDFNTGFGNGFNNFVGNVNQQYGFTIPTNTIGFGTGSGIGTVGTGTDTVGTGTGTIGTGTIATGTTGTGAVGTGTIGTGGSMLI